jgi:hypothetical protein
MKSLCRLAKVSTLVLALLAPSPSLARQQPTCPYPGTPAQYAYPYCHPYPQPRPKPSTYTRSGDTILIDTGESLFPQPAVDPFTLPPGTNFLANVYTNMFDGQGVEMVNTLPSTPANPYNLHEGDPVVTEINPLSPTDDLRAAIDTIARLAAKPAREAAEVEELRKAIQRGLDVLEGNPVPGRAYSGFPVLHYVGPEKTRTVTPILDAAGKTVGGNLDVHQIWYDGHIESDVAFIDPSLVMNVPWTVTYTLDVLNRGEDDFSPFALFVDPPPPSSPPSPSTTAPPASSAPKMALPHVGMDQTFFPMENGTRTVLKIKMPPGRYYSMVYTWGWRMHPPRIQVMDWAQRKISINGGKPMSLPQWEQSVFCPPQNQNCSPRASEDLKVRAISMIGDLAPEKQMWSALREARDAARQGNYRLVLAKAQEARASFDDFRDRTRLPRNGRYKVAVDRDADLTLLYVNNTIYAEFADRSEYIDDAQRIDFSKWKMRGTTLRVTIYNGDFFDHGYMNVDFGGSRGWENQFKSSVKVGGSGCWFTFGRAHWWPNIPGTTPTPNSEVGDLLVAVPPAARSPYKPAVQKVQIKYNYEPSRRLRFYQFDPIHHDVAIFSIH